jgi:very-short-patch-repair endonuclease
MGYMPDHLAPYFMHGVCTERSLRTAVGDAEVDRLLTAGVVVPCPGAVLAFERAVDPWTPLTLLRMRYPDAVGAGRLACWAHRFPPFATREANHFDLISHRKIRDPRVRFRPDLVTPDVVTIAGVSFTSPARTLADLGDYTDDETVERAVESALRRPEIHESELWTIAARLRRQGRHGPAVLGRIIERRGRGMPATDSDLETRFLQLVRRLGFPEPTWRQYPVQRPGRAPLRVDYVWDNGRYLVFVEVDGDGTHANPKALTDDLTRQNYLSRGRPVLLRFTGHHIDFDHDHVAVELSQHLYRTGSNTAAAPAVTAPSNPRAVGRTSAA